MFLRPAVRLAFDQRRLGPTVLIAGVDSVGLDTADSGVGAGSGRFDNLEH